jgi:hypothetical protein
MPSNYVALDSMGMVLHRAESDLGTVLVLEVGRGSVDIRDKKALIQEYDAMQKGMLAQMGKFYADTTYELKGFQVRQFTTRVPNQTFPKRQVVVLLAHGEVMYAFTYAYNNYQRVDAQKEMDYFHNSIRPAEGVTPEGQLGVSGEIAMGETLGKVFLWSVAITTLVAVIFWFMGKQRYVTYIRKAIAVAFLGFSFFFMFVFVGNLILEKAYYQFAVLGAITGLVGMGLLFAKVPGRATHERSDL